MGVDYRPFSHQAQRKGLTEESHELSSHSSLLLSPPCVSPALQLSALTFFTFFSSSFSSLRLSSSAALSSHFSLNYYQKSTTMTIPMRRVIKSSQLLNLYFQSTKLGKMIRTENWTEKLCFWH